MKRAGILLLSFVFAVGLLNAANINELNFKNDFNIAIDILKMHHKFQRPDYDPTKSQVVENQESGLQTPVEEPSGRKINVFPNPCTYSLKVSGVNEGDQIYIYNTVGQLMTSFIADSNEEVIDVHEYELGLYVIAIVDGTKIDKIEFVK